MSPVAGHIPRRHFPLVARGPGVLVWEGPGDCMGWFTEKFGKLCSGLRPSVGTPEFQGASPLSCGDWELSLSSRVYSSLLNGNHDITVLIDWPPMQGTVLDGSNILCHPYYGPANGYSCAHLTDEEAEAQTALSRAVSGGGGRAEI